jgi:coatomer subunit epsilon
MVDCRLAVAHALIHITGVDEQEKGLVRVIAGTAFSREGEIEEALQSLGTGTGVENLDAYVPSKSTPLHAALNRLCLCGSVALIVQIYLSISRVDLAKKEFDRARKWAEDDLLLQQMEASIGLLTGKDSYSNTHSYYVEQLHNPSLSSAHMLVSCGVTHLLRGEIPEAQSDFFDPTRLLEVLLPRN